MKIAVVGAGKMGLPLACQFARQGGQVTACDIRADVVDAINRGVCLINEPGVAEMLEDAVNRGRLKATTDTTAAVSESEVVVVIVPVFLTPEQEADLSIIEQVTCQIAAGLRPGMMVCYETTLPVGTTRRLAAILERSGLKAGLDFDVVFSPERVKSQYVLKHLTQTPKVVGGITPEAAARAEAFYSRYLGAPVVNVGGLEAAELVKLAGMIYRDVNIALVNELARYAEKVGVDIHTVIQAANCDGETHILSPGIGVGGHCTPVYPYFLIRDGQRKRAPVTLAERSRWINDRQVSYMLDRLERAWAPLRGKRVLILGLGFRANVKEHTLSPAFLLREELEKRGAEVSLHDPLYTNEEIRGHGFTSGGFSGGTAPEAIILNTAHPPYAELDFGDLAARGLKAVLDGRALWRPEQVRAANLIYVGVGTPDPIAEPVSQSLPIARPLLLEGEAEAAADAVRSGWVMQGSQVAAFEREFAAYVGAPCACAVSSGTAALHLALLAVGVKPGDEVITVSHSFIATANSIRYCGATPVFVDIEPETFNIDPREIEGAITDRTRAILCVHQMGMPCNLEAIVALARKHNLKVVEDAACALGSEILWNGAWERIGKPHGDVACFSFHPRKVLTTGDGGMITTANSEWDRLFRVWRQHGMTISSSERHSSQSLVWESYPVLGFNYRMTDIQAAIGRKQLTRLSGLVTERRRLVERYRSLLGEIPGLQLPLEPEWARSNWQSFCVRLPDGCNQMAVMQALLDQGISTRRGIMCAHAEAAYVKEYGVQRLPESECAQERGIILPLFPMMTEQEQVAVARALSRALRGL